MTVPYKDYALDDEEDWNRCECGNDPCAHIRPSATVHLAVGQYL